MNVIQKGKALQEKTIKKTPKTEESGEIYGVCFGGERGEK